MFLNSEHVHDHHKLWKLVFAISTILSYSILQFSESAELKIVTYLTGKILRSVVQRLSDFFKIKSAACFFLLFL